MMMKSAHNVFAPPPRSLLRKRSPKTQNRHMNQATKMKNSNSASRKEPLSLNTGTLPLGEPPVGSATRPTLVDARFDRTRLPSASPLVGDLSRPPRRSPGGVYFAAAD